jgi:hypothetical protein
MLPGSTPSFNESYWDVWCRRCTAHIAGTLATCLQQDVDEWLESGPTTRSKVRNLLAWAKKAQLNKSVKITHQQAPPSRALTQDQRLAWLRELLEGGSESLSYRVAGILLLLFAQPLTKVAALRTSAITFAENDVRISLGKEPIPVPPPFANMLAGYVDSRPHLRAAGGLAISPWLFPRVRPGRHRQPQEIMERLGRLGIDLLGARNTALQSLVVAAPSPLVAELLGLQLQHRPAPRRNRSPAMGPPRDQNSHRIELTQSRCCRASPAGRQGSATRHWH